MNDTATYIVTIDDYWLTFALSVLIPAAVALVTSRVASGTVKAMVLIVLSIITGFLTSVQATPDNSFDLKTAVIGFFVSFITAVSIHYGLLKPAGVTGSNGSIQTGVPGGLGGGSQVS